MSHPASALLGQLPATDRDRMVVRGFWRFRTYHTYTSIYDAFYLRTIPATAVTGHDDHRWQVYGSAIAVMLLITLITITRLLLRLCRHDLRWRSDDWLVTIGLMLGVTWCGMVIGCGVNGAGRHLYDITYVNFDRYFAFQTYSPTFFYTSLAFAQLSILRSTALFNPFSSRAWHLYHHALLTLLAIYMLAVVFGYTFLNSPPAIYLSDLGARTGMTRQNKGRKEMLLAFCGIHAAFDLVLLPVPVLMLFKVRGTWKREQMLKLAGLVGLGVVAVLAAVMRTVVLGTDQAVDITYHYPTTIRWSLVDLVLTFTIASLPTLNTLLLPRRAASHSPPLCASPPSSSPARRYRLHGGKMVPCVQITSTAEEEEEVGGHESAREEKSENAAADVVSEKDDVVEDERGGGAVEGDDGEGEERDNASVASSVPWEQRQWGRMHTEGNGRVGSGGVQPDWEVYAPGLKI